jgi:uncharacterized protein YecT (DUF1311 family)
MTNPAEHMSPSQPQPPPNKPPQLPEKNRISPELCRHPRVQIVSRDEECEYVECQECGDVFESSEFKDMMIEETELRDEE